MSVTTRTVSIPYLNPHHALAALTLVPPHAEVIEGIEAAPLQEALLRRTIVKAHQKGKHMWLEFDEGPCLMLHFGKYISFMQPRH